MNKIIYIFIALILTKALADDDHDWYPKDPAAAQHKCNDVLSAETKFNLMKGIIQNSPEVSGFFMCTAKALNIYTSENGFDTARLIYALEKMNRLHNRSAVEECVRRNLDVKPEGTKVFNVAKCVEDENVLVEKV
ncbi:uncharacterized protein LOC131802000 [Musca domestica]|uniref:Uncharacterized protein LOC131802000 n=1 Tax=Musca domestica TaxID=7370 RepID=A0ABM3UUT8_MUSDO|nr:uncharacterized protein LOC131802000 [Musca domestica]